MTFISSMSGHAFFFLILHTGIGAFLRAFGVQLHVDQKLGLILMPYWPGKRCSYGSNLPYSLSVSFCRLAAKGYEC